MKDKVEKAQPGALKTRWEKLPVGRIENERYIKAYPEIFRANQVSSASVFSSSLWPSHRFSSSP
jgi:hypothetical protein